MYTYKNMNWKGWTVLVSSVSKTSSYKRYNGLTLRTADVNSMDVHRNLLDAKYWYEQDVKPNIRCSSGILAGIVEKSGSFALIAPPKRKLTSKFNVNQRIEIYHPVSMTVTKEYRVFVIK